eukprot:g42714.t1
MHQAIELYEDEKHEYEVAKLNAETNATLKKAEQQKKLAEAEAKKVEAKKKLNESAKEKLDTEGDLLETTTQAAKQEAEAKRSDWPKLKKAHINCDPKTLRRLPKQKLPLLLDEVEEVLEGGGLMFAMLPRLLSKGQLGLWFERIEYIDRLTGTEIARYHGDMVHLILNTLSQEAIDQIADMVNMDPKTGKVSGRQWENNDEQYFYLPLLHTWINGMDLDLSTLRGDLEIRFYPRGSIFVAAQSAVNGQSAPAVPCTASLSEIRFITGCTQLPNGMRLGRSPLKQGKVAEQKYIDFVQYTAYAQRIKPSDRLAIDLDQFSHHSGGLFVFIRKSGDQTSYGDATTYYPQYTYDTTGRLMTYDMLGDATTIDLEDVHGRSQMGEGTPIDERFFREETMGQLVRSSYLKSNGVYLIPFSNDPKAMLDGVMDGYKTFVGNCERLVINTGPAPRATAITHKYGPFYANGATFAASDTNRLIVDYKGVTVAILDIDSGLTFARITDRRYTSPATAALTNLNTVLASSSWLRSCGVKIKFSNTRAGASNTVDWEVSASMEYTASVTDLNDQPIIWSRGDVHQLKMKFQQAPDDTGPAYNAQEEMEVLNDGFLIVARYAGRAAGGVLQLQGGGRAEGRRGGRGVL